MKTTLDEMLAFVTIADTESEACDDTMGRTIAANAAHGAGSYDQKPGHAPGIVSP